MMGADNETRPRREPALNAPSNTIPRFRVALTGDFFGPEGTPLYRDMGLDRFHGHDHIEVRPIADHRQEIAPEQIADAQGVIVLTPSVTVRSLASSANLLAIGRFGVGYDAVDVTACTEADVVVFITAGTVDRSVAEATVAWMLALTHHIRPKDRLVREGAWHARSKWMGRELRGRTLGVIGLGGIGRALVRLLEGFDMNPPMAFDPFLAPNVAEAAGVRQVDLDALLASADFVSIHCPLTPRTRGLVGAREIALMRPEAYLINTARGGIVDEDALFVALQAGRLAGAAIDVFADEPVIRPHRFGALENVLLAPHCIAWTDELFRDIGRAACQGMVDLSFRRRPHGAVNPEVFDRPSFQEKWDRLVGGVETGSPSGLPVANLGAMLQP
jgi:phosphoglycerate dehydrogenase-like enzyme